MSGKNKKSIDMARVGDGITLKDVARVANCSTAVVSTVINKARGNTLVSHAMRRRVEKAASDLGYRPNFASRSLVRKRSSTFGIYIAPGPWSGPGFGYEGEILKGIEPAARAQGYDLLLINLTGNQTPDACLEKFAERRIDGLLLLHAEPDSPWIGELAGAGHSLVAIDYPHPQPGLSVISFDNNAVSVLAVRHLLELGHRRIGFLGSCRDPVNRDAAIRQASFIHEMRQRGLDVEPEWIFDVRRIDRPLRPDEAVCQLEGAMGAAHIRKLGKAGPTAWVAYGDLPAVTTVTQLQQSGLRVPDDLSIVGVDDSEWCGMISPALTSVRHPLREMGRRAVELLIANASNDTDSPREPVQITLSPELIARRSSAPPAKV